MLDPRTPVIVGVGQVNGADGAEEPIDLIALASERAIEDAGGKRPPLDFVSLSKIGTWPYVNAPLRLAKRLGAPDARTLQANHGGHTAQVVVAHAASEIACGRARAALVAGGELGSALKKGIRPTPFDEDLAAAPAELGLGDDLSQWLAHPHEVALGISEPIQMYPIMETALGAALGRTREEHAAEIAALWAGFSRVAVDNPYAADRTGYSAEAVGTPSASNRYVGYPYTKQMNSNQFVDQGAAILLCSVEVASELGIPRDRWVFPHASVTAHSPFVSERGALHTLPALSSAGEVLAAMVGRPLHEFELADLYACFPFAVQAQAQALGLSPDMALTLTGGMRYGGGPWNNYATHMIANVVLRVRERPDAMAVCSSNGGLATRFCLIAYSGTPSPDGFRSGPLPLADPTPRRRLTTEPEGDGTIEGYTVLHDRSNHPTHAVAASLLADGSRAWARLHDAEDVAAMLAADPIGREVAFRRGEARLG